MEGDFKLIVKKVGAEKDLSGSYSYLSALARLEHASAQADFCHAVILQPPAESGVVMCAEFAAGCPHRAVPFDER